MSLPIFQDQNKNLMLMQTGWSSQLNPVLSNPISRGLLLTGLDLKVGTNIINHMLGRVQQGWFICDIFNGVASIYRSAPLNAQTLTLTSSAAVSVSLYVF